MQLDSLAEAGDEFDVIDGSYVIEVCVSYVEEYFSQFRS